VLSAGMDKGSYQFTAELYSPPYLFQGARPTISAAPSSVGYGQSFDISTPDAANITRVALIKPGSATHSLAQDQRYVDLAFSQSSDGHLSATAPPDGNSAPPGWYMLFILGTSGVPSVASWVDVG
jgi:galactose oxidase